MNRSHWFPWTRRFNDAPPPCCLRRTLGDITVSCPLQVLEAWKNLLEAAEGRRAKLVDTADKFRFFSMVRDLMLWMDDVIRLIEAQEKPR